MAVNAERLAVANGGLSLAEADGDLAEQAGQVAEAAAVAAAPPAPRREYSTTFRNNPAVIVDGYTFVKKSKVKDVTYWRCSNSNKGCKATGKSAEDSLDIQLSNAAHDHDPDPVQLKAKKLVVEARKRAAGRTQTGAAAIVDELMRGVDDDVALAVDRNNLLRVANRAKRLDGSRQLNRPLAEIVFPDAFTKTATGLRFLLYDSRQQDPGESVIFIFASAQGLQQLRQRHHWSADGTFWCTPRPFDSLYTIHANIGISSVPAAYMLLQNRDEATYARALKALVRCGNLQGVAPTTFMHDFELAAIHAIKAVFPDSLIRLCLFHFAQALWRKLQELGLTVLYKTVKKARILLRCFGALATVPVEEVTQALEAIVQELQVLLYETAEIPMEYNDALYRFEDYFEKTYVRRLDAEGNFAEPRFRPMLWNCHLAILQELHRTNNAVEGWHMEFNNTFTTAHPALDKFIMQLQNDEDKNRQRLVRHEALPANPVRRRRVPAYMVSDKHILAIAQKYRTEYAPAGQVLRYLKCMQHHLAQADFGENEAEAEGDGPHPPAAGDDDDIDDDDIPLNESHPGFGGNADDDEDQGDRQPAANAIRPQAHDAVLQAAQPVAGAQAQQPNQPRVNPIIPVDDLLPGGSQLATAAPNGARRRQSKRVAASQGGNLLGLFVCRLSRSLDGSTADQLLQSVYATKASPCINDVLIWNMADNEYVYDGDVQRIMAAELMPILPSQGGGFRLMFRVEFKDGRNQLRPAADCSCPQAISDYERHYYRAKWAADSDGTPSKASTSRAPSTSHAKSEASSSRVDAGDEGDGSEYADDAHLDHISSGDSLWSMIVDEEGRPGTDPEARAAIRNAWAAGDKTFKTPKTEGSDSGDVSDHSREASVKSEALSDDSLAQELKAKATPPASPDSGPAAHAGRRRKAARLLPFEEWAFGRKKVASDPTFGAVPSGSGLQAKNKTDEQNSPKASTSQHYKKIKLEAEDSSLPAMPVFPAGSSMDKKAVEAIDLTLDDDIFTIDSD